MKQLNRYDTYIKGEQSEEELEDFTKDILKRYYKKEALKEKWDSVLEKDEELVALKNTGKLPEKRTATLYIKIISIAAGVCLFISTWFLYRYLATPSATHLADKYLVESYEPIQLRKGNVQELRLVVLQYFEAQNYEAAIPILNQIQTYSSTIENSFLLGFAYLKLTDWDKALSYFELVLADPSELKREQAIWFASLAHIKAKQPTLAIKKLEVLASRKGWKNKEAIRLLEALSRN